MRPIEYDELFHALVRAIGTITYGKERWFDNNDGTWYDRNECDNVPLGTVVDRLIREVSWLEEQYENAVD